MMSRIRTTMKILSKRSLSTTTKDLLVVVDHTLKYSWLTAETFGGENLTVANTLPLVNWSVFTGSHSGFRLQILNEPGAEVLMNLEVKGLTKAALGGPFQQLVYINQDASNILLRQKTLKEVFGRTSELLNRTGDEDVIVGAFPNQRPQQLGEDCWGCWVQT